MHGLCGQGAVQHVEQARNLEPFKSKHNTRAKYVLDYHRGTVTPSPAQVSTFKIFISEKEEKRNQDHEFLNSGILPDLFSKSCK